MIGYTSSTAFVWQLFIISVVSRHGLTIEAHHRNQPNKRKLALCKPLLHFCSKLKQLCINKIRSTSFIKVGVAYVAVYILRHSK